MPPFRLPRAGAIILVALALTAGATAPRAQSGPPPKLMDGEFELAGGVLTCRAVSLSPKITAELLAKMQTQPCLHIGDVSVGHARQTVEGMLGQPYGAPVRQEGDLTVLLYLLKAADPSQGKEPFYAITYKGIIASEVQLSGPASTPPVGFAGIKLGDPASTVTARVGQPARREPVPANGADLWIYDPHLISFELSNGVVSSIKIAFKRLP